MVDKRHYDRVIAHADRDESTGCLVSRYSVGSHGYAQAWDGSTVTLAHRLVWEYVNGELAPGMTVDHRQGLCSRKCIEITHMRELSNFENGRRQQGRDWPLGECIRGHSNDQLVRRSNGLRCLICEREDQRAYRARRRLKQIS